MKAVTENENGQWDDEITDDRHRQFLFQLQHGLLLALLERGSINQHEYKSAVKRLHMKLKIRKQGGEADQVRLLLPRLDQ